MRRGPWRRLPGLPWLLMMGLLGTGPAPAAAQTGLEIMRRQRDAHRARDEEVTLRITLYSKSGDRKERRLANYVLIAPDDLSKTLLRFIAPRDVENTGLLTWERKDEDDDDQWLYLPSIGKVKRIVSSSKKNRFMGSDLAYEDLRPENLSLHIYTLTGSELVDGQECFLVQAAPATARQAADSGYSKRRLWVRKDIYLTVRQEYYDKKGRLEKIAAARQLVNIRGAMWRANEVDMRDIQTGTRTVLQAETRNLDRGLPERFFTEAELVRGRP